MAEPTYTINVTSVKTKDVDGIGTVIKQVFYDITTEMSGKTFSESRSYILNETSTVLLSGTTRAMMATLVEEQDETIPGIKAYGKYMIEKQIDEEQDSIPVVLPD